MSVMWLRDHPGLTMSLFLGVGVTGGLVYHSRSIAQAVKSARLMRSVKSASRKVYIVNSEESWSQVSSLLLREARLKGAIGFDCEWVQVRGKRRPVALLQLASCSGTCVLVRLLQMKTSIPQTLKEFLADETILKVGVGPMEDSNYLAADYNIQVKGCVDLRHLVLMSHTLSPEPKSKLKPKGMGLNALSQYYLEQTLDKDWRVRASDWEAEELTQRQKNYAAEDALVGIHILVALLQKLWILHSPIIPFLPSLHWHRHLSSSVQQICFPFVDRKFSMNKSEQNGGANESGQTASCVKLKSAYQPHVARRTPLYHYSQMRAPDNELLCVCDPRKALWYVEKGKAKVVSEDPLIIQLNFEPSGRPLADRDDDGRFYLQERLNVCVVCGKGEIYIRKNIVPLEYRKHFPDILKNHQSHDVVLLCLDCHKKSNLEDKVFRYTLAKEFDAPIGNEHSKKTSVDRHQITVKNAAKALVCNRANIPEKRVLELENILKSYLETDCISETQLREMAQTDSKFGNKAFQSHGHKVYEAYEKVGLIKLIQRWRKHFLSSMKPQHMPIGWSVTHNICALKVKMSQYPKGHPERLKYKVALVGTEGIIDIPYMPDISKEESPAESESKEMTPESLSEAQNPPTDLKAAESDAISEGCKNIDYSHASECFSAADRKVALERNYESESQFTVG
ncbi:exonuclease 3'-5' domain-containing protein 2-like isoform X1 [Penaeus chinensis]|uniref:exonuclease 3'-5' domain-containing protein 2-like isoform X1 n=1 Tax=Penaeus chinensis TaxID=139456 RepID=UPI001FB85280|nr:exonuclease 3'-5' domain-containing protein 2-like isoform X1 [Penaeus chinensis]XP_047489597.1 exonuclease 3'-5' domain-containing protein 2-like isoform X1 [Penaeus chinensis]XP_047489598.1 exonuclease 3'-5' domain-containing protein 2-like isoform X1 [Penaeus chinensis]XP_047489599.1 exonuclease 3'-5' domain-containing protein 2-like isoform X1 [Penaeus chinensis]